MSMLAKQAVGLRSGNRFAELVSSGCPDELADLCARPMVWTREKAGVTYAVTNEQTHLGRPILQEEWIEYIPVCEMRTLPDGGKVGLCTCGKCK